MNKTSRSGAAFPRGTGARLIGMLGLCILLAASPLFAEGKSDTANASGWTITSPSTALPGDCIVISFTSDVPLADAAVMLSDSSGKAVVKARAFDSRQLPAVATAAGMPSAVTASASPAAGIQPAAAALLEPAVIAPAPGHETNAPSRPKKSKGDKFVCIALAGVPSTLDPGDYTVNATAVRDGEPISSMTPIHIESRTFISDTVVLDSANTAIKTNTGPERLSQIDKLNEILFRSDPASPRFTGPFKPPLQSTRRTSQYGERRKYQYANGNSEQNVHYGIDFGVPTGTPVFAAGDGLVVMAEKRFSTGWSVVIEHLPGVYSLYYHMDALTTAEGEYVRAGTLIGRSGATGLATGPHLHWEFRVNGESVSPDWFVGRTIY